MVIEDNYLKLDQVCRGLNAESRLSDLMSNPQFAESSEKVKSMALISNTSKSTNLESVKFYFGYLNAEGLNLEEFQ